MKKLWVIYDKDNNDEIIELVRYSKASDVQKMLDEDTIYKNHNMGFIEQSKIKKRTHTMELLSKDSDGN